MKLYEKKCGPCSDNRPSMKEEQLIFFLNELHDDWTLIESEKIERTFSFSNFKKGLSFINQVGELAEEENHHPTVLLNWGLVKLSLWTNHIKGLSENDFILAAKIDRLL